MVTSAGRGQSRAAIINLRRERERRLAAELAPTLRHTHAVAPVDTLHSVDEWRTAVRMAGRANGWRMRTGLSPDGSRVWAVRVDVEPDEAALHDAAERLGDYLGQRRSPARSARRTRSRAGLHVL